MPCETGSITQAPAPAGGLGPPPFLRDGNRANLCIEGSGEPRRGFSQAVG